MKVPGLRLPDIGKPKIDLGKEASSVDPSKVQPPKPPELSTEPPSEPPSITTPAQRQPAALGEPRAPKKPTAPDIAHELMISNMLFQVSTHKFNMVENAIKGVTAPLETGIRAILSIGRTDTDKTFMREAIYGAGGLMHGFSSALRWAAWRAKSHMPGAAAESQEATMARIGVSKELLRGSKIAEHRRHISSEQFFGPGDKSLTGRMVDTVGAITNIPGTVLNASDMLFKIMHYNRKMAEDAANMWARGGAKNITEAAEAIRNDPSWAKSAVKDAEYWTYQAEPATAIKWILSTKSDEAPFLRFIVPFRRAVANLFEHTVERSPLVMLSPVLRKKLTDPDLRVRDTARSRLIFGMSALTGMAYLTQGNVTSEDGTISRPRLVGSAPRDRMMADMFRRKNGEEDMLWITHDKGFNARELGVYGAFLRYIANYQQWNANVRQSEMYADETRQTTEKFWEEFGKQVSPMFDALYDNHWAKNIVEFMDVVAMSIDRENPEPLAYWLERNLGRMPPILGAGWVRNMAIREDPHAKEILGSGDIITASLPGLRELIGNSWTWDGQPMRHSSMYKSASKHFDTLEYYGERTPLDDMLVDLQVKFSKPSDVLSVPTTEGTQGGTVVMTDDEWNAYNRIRFTGLPEFGLPTLREFLQTTVIDGPMFKIWGDDTPAHKWERKTLLELGWEAYISVAKTTMRADKSPGSLQERLKKRYLQNIKEFNEAKEKNL